MKTVKFASLCVALVMMVGGLLSARTDKFGVADFRTVKLTAPTRIGDVLLPQGEYEVRHVMEADNHVMVFKQVGPRKPTEARVKCNLVPLKAKAKGDQITYGFNAANERVMQSLQFRGDTAEHVF